MRRRWLPAVIAFGACAARPAAPTTPAIPAAPSAAPAHDLATARPSTPREHGGKLEAKDPRVIDLDIIRITAHARAPGAEPELDDVATGDLFRQANAASKSGATDQALALYRRIIVEFPESQFAPVSLYNSAAIYDGRNELEPTIETLRELVAKYPDARESVDGQLYIAALQAEHEQLADAIATLDAALTRTNLTYVDRIEAHARRGFCLLGLHRLDEADAALGQAIDAWRHTPRVDDPYYIAMAFYDRGELAHRRFQDAPLRLPDDQLIADLEAKRQLAVAAYDQWRQALRFQQAYWATAAGYQMSQIFVELWQITVQAPYPAHVAPAARAFYVSEVHARVREYLDKALDGHRMNVELAKAFGVDTTWSRASAQRAAQLFELLAKDRAGDYVTPDTHDPIAAVR
jgi:tetratricopeptide (TPR) repeat protein